MKLTFNFIFYVVFTITLAACTNVTEPSSGSSRLIDFAPNRTWIYKIDAYDKWLDRRIVLYDTITVAPKKTDVQGEPWDSVIHHDSYSAIPDFFPCMVNKDDGVWVTFSSDDSLYRLFKYPVNIGEQYSIVPNRVITHDEYLYTAKMLETSIETYRNVKYVCYNYEYIVSGGHEAQIRRITIAPGFTILKGRYITSDHSKFDTIYYALQ